MIIIATGGRDYILKRPDYQYLTLLHTTEGFSLVITGDADGADTCVDNWARVSKIDRIIVPANWDKHGRAAGPMRNSRMLDLAMLLSRHQYKMPVAGVAFPGNRGTSNMVSQLKMRGCIVYSQDVRY